MRGAQVDAGIDAGGSFQHGMEALHEAARKATGLSDFGPPDYREGLRRLLAAYDCDMRFTESGRQFAIGGIVGTLAQRLLSEEGWKRRPDCRSRSIRQPLLITGIPRSGTTALHKLLAMDPQFQGLEHWLTESPMVRPPRATWASNPAFRASVAGLEAFFRMMPQMRKAHDMVADEVEECLDVLRQSFVSNRFGSSACIPSYDAWLFEQDEHDSYRRYADVLRLIGADEPDTRWLLKNPGHVARMECLLAVFPDALIVQTHRDPVKAIPSLCSTLHMARRMYEGDATRPELIGPREIRYWSQAVTRAGRVRAMKPNQFFDVDHRRFHEDPLGVVRAIYDRFGLTLGVTALERMRKWIAASPTRRHGEHHYVLEDYGVTATQIRSAFADYIDRYRLA